MMALVTREQALAHLKADSTEDVSIYLSAAELAAMEYLNRNVYESEAAMDAAVLAGNAGEDPMVVNDLIKAAVLLIAGHLYRNREDVISGQTAAAVQLPLGSRALLQPYRVGMGV
jgi:predicted HD phosphohydrolase